jgi:hypothetical protein
VVDGRFQRIAAPALAAPIRQNQNPDPPNLEHGFDLPAPVAASDGVTA